MGTSEDFWLACLHGCVVIAVFVITLIVAALAGDDDNPEPELGCYWQPQHKGK